MSQGNQLFHQINVIFCLLLYYLKHLYISQAHGTKKCTVNLLPLLTTCCSFLISVCLLVASVKENWWRVLLTFWKQSGMGFLCELASREGCCTNSLHGVHNSQFTAPSPRSDIFGSSWLQCVFSGRVLFACCFFVPVSWYLLTVKQTGLWLLSAGKETCLLALLVRNSSQKSCCPVSQIEQENPEGYKTGTF